MTQADRPAVADTRSRRAGLMDMKGEPRTLTPATSPVKHIEDVSNASRTSFCRRAGRLRFSRMNQGTDALRRLRIPGQLDDHARAASGVGNAMNPAEARGATAAKAMAQSSKGSSGNTSSHLEERTVDARVVAHGELQAVGSGRVSGEFQVEDVAAQ